MARTTRRSSGIDGGGSREIVEDDPPVEEAPASTQLTDSQQVTATITPVNRRGNPAAIDGVPVWHTSDATVVTVTAEPDDRSAVIRAVTSGKARITVSADADLGEGVQAIVAILEVEVIPGHAVQVRLTLDKLTEQVDPS